MKYDLIILTKINWGGAKHKGSIAYAFSGTAPVLEVRV